MPARTSHPRVAQHARHCDAPPAGFIWPEISGPAYPKREPRPDEPSKTVVLFVVIALIIAMNLLVAALTPDLPVRAYGEMDPGMDYGRPAR